MRKPVMLRTAQFDAGRKRPGKTFERHVDRVLKLKLPGVENRAERVLRSDNDRICGGSVFSTHFECGIISVSQDYFITGNRIIQSGCQFDLAADVYDLPQPGRRADC